MKKDIKIQFTEEEFTSLLKMWEKAKKNSIFPSKTVSIEEFCKEIIITFVKGPDLSALKDINLSDLMSQIGDLNHLKDIFNSFSKKSTESNDKKKDITPDDKKYKS